MHEIFHSLREPISSFETTRIHHCNEEIFLPQFSRSHSFHGSKSDVLFTTDDEMECDDNFSTHNPSLQDASSLSQLVDSVVAEVQLLNEAITDEDELTFQHSMEAHQHHQKNLVPKISVEDEEDHLRTTTNEEEELSEYWDQVIHYWPLSDLIFL